MDSDTPGDRPTDANSLAQGDPGGSRGPDDGATRAVISTTDPSIEDGGVESIRQVRPDETIVAETGRVADVVPASTASTSPFVEPTRPVQARPPGDSSDPAKAKKYDDKPEVRRNRAALVITLVASLACGMAGAWAYNHFEGSRSKGSSQAGGDEKQGGEDSSKKEDPSTSPAKGDPGASTSGSMSSEGDDALKKQVQYLGSRLDLIQQRMGSIAAPRDTNSPDLEALRVKVGELSKAIHETTSNPDRSRQVDGRLDRLQAEIRELRDQMAASKDRPDRPADAPPAVGADRKDEKPQILPPPPPPAPVPPAVPAKIDDAMASAIALFKKGQYMQADESFRQLRLTRPQDARVWYLSALAHGLATGQWEGEARRFVVHGADQERAGVPPTAQIDAAFADLTPAQGKEWLASYRSQLLKP